MTFHARHDPLVKAPNNWIKHAGRRVLVAVRGYAWAPEPQMTSNQYSGLTFLARHLDIEQCPANIAD